MRSEESNWPVFFFVLVVILFAAWLGLGCGDQSYTALLFDLREEDARALNDREQGIYYGTAHCMKLDDPSSEPVIEFCIGDSDDTHCVDRETVPGALGTYRTQFDLVSIHPEWKGVDGLLAHEFIHAILYRETGDADGCHQGGFFKSCAPESFIANNQGPECEAKLRTGLRRREVVH